MEVGLNIPKVYVPLTQQALNKTAGTHSDIHVKFRQRIAHFVHVKINFLILPLGNGCALIKVLQKIVDAMRSTEINIRALVVIVGRY